MTSAAPQQPNLPARTNGALSAPAVLAAAELNLRGIAIEDCVVVLVDGQLPVAQLSLSLPDDNVQELRVRVELPERGDYTLRSRLYATSVEHLSFEGRSLPLDVDLQVALCAWCEEERSVRLEIERAWERAIKDERDAALSYLAAE